MEFKSGGQLQYFVDSAKYVSINEINLKDILQTNQYVAYVWETNICTTQYHVKFGDYTKLSKYVGWRS